MSAFPVALVCLALAGCASQRDHFYTLDILPDSDQRGRAAIGIHVLLSVTVPSIVDRAPMVLTTSNNGISVLEHERWASPLSDQVAQTLARDIEIRRNDILVGDRGFDQATVAPVVLKVDIVRMSAQLGGRATVEAHWRVIDTSLNVDEMGSDFFTVPLDGTSHAAVAGAYSQTLSSLAELLADKVRRR